MSDSATRIVILSERSESKDLYLPQLAHLPAEARRGGRRRVNPIVALRHE